MNPTYDFTGQVAVVTGAGAGMGLDTARAFAAVRRRRRPRRRQRGRAARRHRRADRRRPPGARRRLRRRRRGPGRRARRAHRRRASAGSTWPSTTPASCSRPPTPPTSRPSTSTASRAINLRGVWACMKHELRQMRDQGSGAIVNCSSLGGLVGNSRPRLLPRHQARRPRPHQERRARVRAARHPDQRRLPRHDRDPDGRRHDRQGRARPSPKPRPASPSAASAAGTRSPPPSCGCAAPARASCTASRCPSTAATRRVNRNEETMTTTNRSAPSRARHALVIALFAAMSLPACGGADDEPGRRRTRGSTPAPGPTSAQEERRRPGRHADPDHASATRSSRRGCTKTPRHAISPLNCR